MNIRLHIEHLLLDGLPLAASQEPALRAALQAELGRLIVEDGMNAGSRSVDFRRGGDIRSAVSDTPARIGERIAGAVYAGITA
jgi:hypothetical protein